jgi:predicted DNA-binding transcriptional regulator AlpA
MKEVIFEKAESLLRLNEVLRRFPVSKSSWWLGVKERRYPAPVKIGRRAVA